jgi:Uma2 family endonuclease
MTTETLTRPLPPATDEQPTYPTTGARPEPDEPEPSDIPDIEKEKEERESRPLSPDEWPNIDHIETEDDTPVDNLASEKQQRLLTEPLYSSWHTTDEETQRIFLVAANIGLFYAIYKPPLVPDVLLSLGVEVADNWWDKRHRSYFTWEFGKPPEVVIEIVSNRKGGELSTKLAEYARIGILYYAVFDPAGYVSGDVLRLYKLERTTQTVISTSWMPEVGLGLTLWEGSFEGKHETWLRWCDQDGNVIPTGAERAEQERQRAEREFDRAERLAALLREHGIAFDE